MGDGRFVESSLQLLSRCWMRPDVCRHGMASSGGPSDRVSSRRVRAVFGPGHAPLIAAAPGARGLGRKEDRQQRSNNEAEGRGSGVPLPLPLDVALPWPRRTGARSEAGWRCMSLPHRYSGFGWLEWRVAFMPHAFGVELDGEPRQYAVRQGRLWGGGEGEGGVGTSCRSRRDGSTQQRAAER